MIQAGLAAPDTASLPAPLQAPGITKFPAGRSLYTLEWTNVELDRFIELRPAASYDKQAAVIARFGMGLCSVSVYPCAESQTCGTY